MIRSLIASGLAILVASATTSQPVEARGGFARAGSFHHPAPFVRNVPIHSSFDRHHLNPPFGQGFREGPGFHRFASWRHRGVGWELPFGYGGYYGSYDEPSVVYGSPDAAWFDTPYQVMAVVGPPPGNAHTCRSETQWVPGDHGLTRVVVTRC